MVQHDIEIPRDTDLKRTLTWKNDDGTAYSLTGYTARFVLRSERDRSQRFTKALTINAAGGIMTLDVTDTEVEGFDVSTFSGHDWFIEVTDAGDTTTRLIGGKAKIVE